LDGKNLPSKRAITAITQDLLRLLFPDFFDENRCIPRKSKRRRRRCLNLVLGKLENEIRKSLEYNPPDKLQKKDIAKAAYS